MLGRGTTTQWVGSCAEDFAPAIPHYLERLRSCSSNVMGMAVMVFLPLLIPSKVSKCKALSDIPNKRSHEMPASSDMRENLRPDRGAVYSDRHATKIRKRLGDEINPRQAECSNYDQSSGYPCDPLTSAPLVTVTEQIHSQSSRQQGHHRGNASDDPRLPLTGRR